MRTCLHRGGYSPYHLVFGTNTRLPGDLLSDDAIAFVGPSDLQQDAVAADGVPASLARQYEIRQESRRLLMSVDAIRKLPAANHAAKHRDQNDSCGQQVCVWRRAV